MSVVGRVTQPDQQGEIASVCAAIEPDAVALRRDLHANPELGWCEYRTTSLVHRELEELGCAIRWGRELYGDVERLGVPDATTLAEFEARAIATGVPAQEIRAMAGGRTGLIATFDSGRPGPTIAVRADIDALPLDEDPSAEHLPTRDGYRSQVPNVMHACAHDGHTAVAVGLARALRALGEPKRGRVVLVFQPAEEGTRGADALVRAGAVDQLDVALTYHILSNVGLDVGQIGPDVSGMLATRKVRIECRGYASQFASSPQHGRNALTVASAIVLLSASIPRKPGIRSMINCGKVVAGTASNVVPALAVIEAEVRSEDEAEVDRLSGELEMLVRGLGSAFGVETTVVTTGLAPTSRATPDLAALVAHEAREMGLAVRGQVVLGASDDAAIVMRQAQQRGGQGIYIALGSGPYRPHHSPDFDFDERAIGQGIELLARTIVALQRSDPGRDSAGGG
ncbi:MAG TPA: amidohydrolase [Candidatus Limnocylindrales bacterium]|nr:amidohydrolase [Candidatus Limnocylindrales bacterium]